MATNKRADSAPLEPSGSFDIDTTLLQRHPSEFRSAGLRILPDLAATEASGAGPAEGVVRVPPNKQFPFGAFFHIHESNPARLRAACIFDPQVIDVEGYLRHVVRGGPIGDGWADEDRPDLALVRFESVLDIGQHYLFLYERPEGERLSSLLARCKADARPDDVRAVRETLLQVLQALELLNDPRHLAKPAQAATRRSGPDDRQAHEVFLNRRNEPFPSLGCGGVHPDGIYVTAGPGGWTRAQVLFYGLRHRVQEALPLQPVASFAMRTLPYLGVGERLPVIRDLDAFFGLFAELGEDFLVKTAQDRATSLARFGLARERYLQLRPAFVGDAAWAAADQEAALGVLRTIRAIVSEAWIRDEGSRYRTFRRFLQDPTAERYRERASQCYPLLDERLSLPAKDGKKIFAYGRTRMEARADEALRRALELSGEERLSVDPFVDMADVVIHWRLARRGETLSSGAPSFREGLELFRTWSGYVPRFVHPAPTEAWWESKFPNPMRSRPRDIAAKYPSVDFDAEALRTDEGFYDAVLREHMVPGCDSKLYVRADQVFVRPDRPVRVFLTHDHREYLEGLRLHFQEIPAPRDLGLQLVMQKLAAGLYDAVDVPTIRDDFQTFRRLRLAFGTRLDPALLALYARKNLTDQSHAALSGPEDGAAAVSLLLECLRGACSRDGALPDPRHIFRDADERLVFLDARALPGHDASSPSALQASREAFLNTWSRKLDELRGSWARAIDRHPGALWELLLLDHFTEPTATRFPLGSFEGFLERVRSLQATWSGPFRPEAELAAKGDATDLASLHALSRSRRAPCTREQVRRVAEQSGRDPAREPERAAECVVRIGSDEHHVIFHPTLHPSRFAHERPRSLRRVLIGAGLAVAVAGAVIAVKLGLAPEAPVLDLTPRLALGGPCDDSWAAWPAVEEGKEGVAFCRPVERSARFAPLGDDARLDVGDVIERDGELLTTTWQDGAVHLAAMNLASLEPAWEVSLSLPGAQVPRDPAVLRSAFSPVPSADPFVLRVPGRWQEGETSTGAPRRILVGERRVDDEEAAAPWYEEPLRSALEQAPAGDAELPFAVTGDGRTVAYVAPGELGIFVVDEGQPARLLGRCAELPTGLVLARGTPGPVVLVVEGAELRLLRDGALHTLPARLGPTSRVAICPEGRHAFWTEGGLLCEWKLDDGTLRFHWVAIASDPAQAFGHVAPDLAGTLREAQPAGAEAPVFTPALRERAQAYAELLDDLFAEPSFAEGALRDVATQYRRALSELLGDRSGRSDEAFRDLPPEPIEAEGLLHEAWRLLRSFLDAPPDAESSSPTTPLSIGAR